MVQTIHNIEDERYTDIDTSHRYVVGMVWYGMVQTIHNIEDERYTDIDTSHRYVVGMVWYSIDDT